MRNRDDSSSRRMVMKCCSARISVGAMNATWKPFSIATSAAISATIVLPEPTSPCSSRFIGCGRFMSLDDLGDDLLLIAGQLERQHAARRFPDLVGDDDRPRLALRVARRFRRTRPTGRGRTPRRSAGAAPASGTRSALDRRSRPESAPERARRGDRAGRAARAGPPAAGRAASSGSCASAWCTSTRCILVVSVPVFS